MRNFYFFIAACTAFIHALTLEQVRSDLKNAFLDADSVEIGIQTTLSSSDLLNPQKISVYFVRKGPRNVFAEVKMPHSSQRTIVCGDRMKSIDLNTRKFQILPYDGKALEMFPEMNFHLLDSSGWKEPEPVSEEVFVIDGTGGRVYYNARKKRMEEWVSKGEVSVRTVFAYDAVGNLKTMTTTVSAPGVETKVVSEIRTLRHSRNFPDALFDF